MRAVSDITQGHIFRHFFFNWKKWYEKIDDGSVFVFDDTLQAVVKISEAEWI